MLNPTHAHFPFLKSVIEQPFGMRISLLPTLKRNRFRRQANEHAKNEGESQEIYKRLCDEFVHQQREEITKFVADSENKWIKHIADTDDPYQFRIVLDEDAIRCELQKWIPQDDDCPQMSNWGILQHWEYDLQLSPGKCTPDMINEAIRTRTPFRDASAEKRPTIKTTAADDQVSDWHQDASSYIQLLDPRDNVAVVTIGDPSKVQGTLYLPLKVFHPDTDSELGPKFPIGTITFTFSMPDGTAKEVRLSRNQHLGIAIIDALTGVFCEQAPEHLWKFVSIGHMHNVPSCYYHRSPPCSSEECIVERLHYVIDSPTKFQIDPLNEAMIPNMWTFQNSTMNNESVDGETFDCKGMEVDSGSPRTCAL